MPSLLGILGLDGSRFKAGLDKAVSQAKHAGKEIDSALGKGATQELKGFGSSGSMRETLVLIREIGRGNWSRVPGSFSLLLQRAGALKYILNPLTGIIVGLVAGAAAAYKLSKNLVETLSGLKMPTFHPEYIAKHLQSANAAAEAQKEINKEAQKSVDLFNSAAKAAERQAKVTKEHFEHLRKMNEYAKERELEEAVTEKQKNAVRKKYSELDLKLSAEERDAELANKQKEAAALDKEAQQRKAQGDAIRVNSKEHDEEILKQRKQAADEAQKYLDSIAEKGLTAKAKDKLVRAYNSVALSGVSGKDLDAAKKANETEARRRISSYDEFVDIAAQNDESRKWKGAFYKEAGESAAKAVTASLEAKELRDTDAQKSKDLAEEAAAKLKAESEKVGHNRHLNEINSLQKIGAYASIPVREMDALNVQKQNLSLLQQINGHLEKISKDSGGHKGAHF